MNNTTNYFTQLANIDVSQHLETKGQFSYLSWPYAVQQLRSFDASATWEVRRFEGLPYLCTEFGTFVEVAVTVKSVTLSQIHPVLDQENKPLIVPSVFDINTSIQRCLVKAIALHGLGLNVYAGEDLPHSESDGTRSSQPSPVSRSAVAALANHNAKHKAKHDNGFSQPELLTNNQLRYLKRLMMETHSDESLLLEYFGFEALTDIPKFEVNRVIRMLESNRDKEAA